jgi:propanol-preferring alcohol dehydrogenase
MPVPRPGTEEVLVQVEACGVGLTVLNALNGELSEETDRLPVVPGHEFVGRVIAAGPSKEAEKLIGQRVVAYFYLHCGICSECMDARESLCRNFAGFVGVHCDGGYAPYAVLPVRNAIPVPEDLDPAAATVIPDAVATPVHVCRDRAKLSPYDRVLVIGAGGGVGIHMVQVARLHGAQVAGLEIEEEKLSTLEELGVLPVRSGPFAELDPLSIWPDGAASVVIDLVGSNESLNWSAEALASRGTLIVLTPFRERELRVDPRNTVLQELSVVGARYASRAEVSMAADLVASARIRPVIGAHTDARELPTLHERLRNGKLLGRGALRWET